jgi:hypothetical protein
MHRRRRLVALAVALAALGAAPATVAGGRTDDHPGTPAHADRIPGSAPVRAGSAAGRGAPRTGHGGRGDGRGPDEGVGTGHEEARTGGADRTDPFVVVASATAGVGALVALVLSVLRALRRRRG